MKGRCDVIGPLVHRMEPTLSGEISYLSDDTPSRRAPPRGTIISERQGLVAAGQGEGGK